MVRWRKERLDYGVRHPRCPTSQTQMWLRVLNVAFQVASLAGNVYRYADSDATVTFFTKEGMWMSCYFINTWRLIITSYELIIKAFTVRYSRNTDRKVFKYSSRLSSKLCCWKRTLVPPSRDSFEGHPSKKVSKSGNEENEMTRGPDIVLRKTKLQGPDDEKMERIYTPG